MYNYKTMHNFESISVFFFFNEYQKSLFTYKSNINLHKKKKNYIVF